MTDHVYKNPLRIDSANASPGYYGGVRAVAMGSLLVTEHRRGLDHTTETLFDLASFDVELKLTRKMKPGLFRLAKQFDGTVEDPKLHRTTVRHFKTREELAEHTQGKMEWVRVQMQDIKE